MLSSNLLQLWLTQFDRGELGPEEVEASLVTEYEAKIAALERKVGQLTMELDLAKKLHELESLQTASTYRLSAAEACSIRRGCNVIDLPRSTYYYRSEAHEPELTDDRLIALICDIRDQFAG